MKLMPVIVWLMLGGIAGWIMSLAAGISHLHGIVESIMVGVTGAVVGGYFVTSLGGRNIGTVFDPYGLVVSVFGAMVLLLGYRAVSRAS